MTEHERMKKREYRKAYYAKTANIYRPRRWHPDDVKLVMEHSIPDSELSVKLDRSVKSIQEKRRREKYKTEKDGAK